MRFVTITSRWQYAEMADGWPITPRRPNKAGLTGTPRLVRCAASRTVPTARPTAAGRTTVRRAHHPVPLSAAADPVAHRRARARAGAGRAGRIGGCGRCTGLGSQLASRGVWNWSLKLPLSTSRCRWLEPRLASTAIPICGAPSSRWCGWAPIQVRDSLRRREAAASGRFPVGDDVRRRGLSCGQRAQSLRHRGSGCVQYYADGSLDLYLQHANPGADKQANWLPAPPGVLGVTMRLYAPRREAIAGTWHPPAVHKV